MGWYGDSNELCPNCKNRTAETMYRNSLLESYYLVCTNCGLCLFAEERSWVVTSSYIDNGVVGMDGECIDPTEIVDKNKNQNIIPKGTGL